MPIYEYRCEACGHELEAMQKMSDAPLTDCDECGKPALRKMISAAGFQLKGSGWYQTDFKDKGKGKTSSAGDKTKSESASASGTSGGTPCSSGACPAA